MKVMTEIIRGDCNKELIKLQDNSIDLIFTSPPYTDQRKNTYGGIHPDKYVEWLLPISKQLLRVLKPTGTFILNIKEKVVDGQSSTYVMELILEMKRQGWLWTEEFIWHKKTVIRENGRIGLEILEKDFSNLTRIKNLTCTKMKS